MRAKGKPNLQPGRVRSWLEVDRVPVTRRELVWWAAVAGCYLTNPEFAAVVVGVGASAAAVTLAALR